MTLQTFQETPGYLTDQLITYLGNKRALLTPILNAVHTVKQRLNKPRLQTLDAFAGSGVVSRALKPHSDLLISNDLEHYAALIGKCFLTNRSEVNSKILAEHVQSFNAWVDEGNYLPGFIQELYAPATLDSLTTEDRLFYTPENARRLDTFRQLIEGVRPQEQNLLLGPLLSKASIHANTTGHFRSFLRDKATGIGKLGGTHSGAYNRITGKIYMEVPLLSRYECAVQVYQEDTNQLIRRLKGLDLAYLDPPYNVHAYASNYFMLNLISKYERPTTISKKAGIPVDWQRSEYNSKLAPEAPFTDLIENTDAKFLLVSYNDSGWLPVEEVSEILQKHGKVERVEIPYKAYTNSRTTETRSTENLFLVER